MSPLSGTAQVVRDTIVNLAHDESSGWEPVPGVGLTIRWTREHDTPDWARWPASKDAAPTWGHDSYHEHVFVTMIAGKVILGHAPAPWIGRRDSEIALWLALAILADHTLAGDHERINAMRIERKAGCRANGTGS